MKKDCWAVLGIARTTDTTLIKKAYRDLIKKYHPDTVQAPEKIRKYTIKCAEIIQAYKEALVYAATYQREPEIISKTERTVPETTAPAQPPPGAFAKACGAFILLLFITPVVFLVIELLNIYPAVTNSTRFVFTCYDSMPAESPLKMIVSFPLALILGALFSGVISIFTTAPVLYLWGVLSDTKYEKHMYKIGYVIITGLNIFVIYFVVGLHWPFEHRATDYYNFLYHLCRFLSWSYGPIYMLTEWLMDSWKYLRVKDSIKSDELILYKEDSVQE
jgi:hypothetical protein